MNASQISTLCDFTTGTRSYVANKQEKINLQESLPLDSQPGVIFTIPAEYSGRPFRVVNNTNETLLVSAAEQSSANTTLVTSLLPGDAAAGRLSEDSPTIVAGPESGTPTAIGTLEVVIL